MKKALSYMIVGALTYGVIDMYINNKSKIEKHMRKLKAKGMEACEKVKAMF